MTEKENQGVVLDLFYNLDHIETDVVSIRKFLGNGALDAAESVSVKLQERLGEFIDDLTEFKDGLSDSDSEGVPVPKVDE